MWEAEVEHVICPIANEDELKALLERYIRQISVSCGYDENQKTVLL
jgi:hypothetical protein